MILKPLHPKHDSLTPIKVIRINRRSCSTLVVSVLLGFFSCSSELAKKQDSNYSARSLIEAKLFSLARCKTSNRNSNSGDGIDGVGGSGASSDGSG